ncbi:Ribosomal RNA large subunit methyltransferase G [Dissostichus eleginoides]|uniref:Ribosomal RNA large subunit methyltransferase G n=1 Tax=Dissostichus eleginoides TaxID=100907 RepID=A0AAD9B9K8_DISEL|nr:Ribosomal RNA large subunit methyltransferase G [Dissostichus eleginoides]
MKTQYTGTVNCPSLSFQDSPPYLTYQQIPLVLLPVQYYQLPIAQPLVVQQQRMLLRTSLNWKKLKRNKWTLLKRKKRTLLKRKGPVPLKTTTCQSPLQTMWMWMNFQDVQLGTGNHQNDFATQNLDNQY